EPGGAQVVEVTDPADVAGVAVGEGTRVARGTAGPRRGPRRRAERGRDGGAERRHRGGTAAEGDEQLPAAAQHPVGEGPPDAEPAGERGAVGAFHDARLQAGLAR